MILIADSGSTKTDWLLMTENGEIQREWNSQGFNPFFQSPETIRSLFENEVFPQVEEAPGSVFFYGAGCASPEASAPIVRCLQERYPDAHIEVDSDLLGAARSLCQKEAGIACILGTGSNNCLYDGTKIVGNIGSLGFWMGDEGSGGHLGKQLVIHYLHRELPEDLMQQFAEKYPDVERFTVLDRAYKQPFPNRYFARFTHFINEHRNHPYLQELVRQSFRSFLEKYVIKHPGSEEYPVSFVGSIAWHFRDILADVLQEKGLRPGIILQRPINGLVKFHRISG